MQQSQVLLSVDSNLEGGEWLKTIICRRMLKSVLRMRGEEGRAQARARARARGAGEAWL